MSTKEIQDIVDVLMAEHEPIEDSRAVQVATSTAKTLVDNEPEMQVAARINRGPFSNKMREIVSRSMEETEKDRERAAVQSLGTGQEPSAPATNDKKAIERYEEAKRFRQQRVDFYSGKRPDQKTGNTVWEAGQKNWKGENPETRRYYVIGKRPLASGSGNTGYDTLPGLAEHRQFISNDGEKNKGLFPDGFRAESVDLVHQYEYYDEKKYDAELIEQAMTIIEKEMSTEAKQDKKGSLYSVRKRNCQHYTDRVINAAELLSKQQGKELVF